MHKTRTIKKISLYIIFSLLIFIGCITDSIAIKFCEGIFFLFVLILIDKCYAKKFKLDNLSIDYHNQKQLLYDIFKYCPDLIFYKDKNFKYAGCNKAFLDSNGINNIEEVIDKNDFELWTNEKAQEIRKHDEFVLKQGKELTNLRPMPGLKANNLLFETTKAPLIINGETVGILGISRDITLSNNLQKSLIEKQIQMTTILDTMPCIVYLKDIKGKSTIGNRNFNELTDSSSKNKIGLSLADLSQIDAANEISDEDKKIIENKEIVITEKEIESQNGKLWLEIHKAPIFNEKEEVTGIVVIIKNITVDKEIDIQKETFIATLTHDLKTPTSAQIRALTLLLNGSFGELKKEQKEMIEQTLNSCKYMFNMISTILSTYKQENGRTNLKY